MLELSRQLLPVLQIHLYLTRRNKTNAVKKEHIDATQKVTLCYHCSFSFFPEKSEHFLL